MEVFSKILVGLGVTGSCGSVAAPFLIGSSTNDATGNQKITFGELLIQIDENWKKEQKSKSQALKELPVKEELERGLLTETSTKNDKMWEIIKNEWRDCLDVQTNINNYCGYLVVYNDNISYKLKIDYEIDNHQWKGYLVKNDWGHKKYWDSKDSQWKEITGIDFNALESFNDTNESEWRKMQEFSFKKEIEKMSDLK